MGKFDDFIEACIKLKLNEKTEKIDLPDRFDYNDIGMLSLEINDKVDKQFIISLEVDWPNRKIFGTKFQANQ